MNPRVYHINPKALLSLTSCLRWLSYLLWNLSKQRHCLLVGEKKSRWLIKCLMMQIWLPPVSSKSSWSVIFTCTFKLHSPSTSPLLFFHGSVQIFIVSFSINQYFFGWKGEYHVIHSWSNSVFFFSFMQVDDLVSELFVFFTLLWVYNYQ